MCCRGLKTDFRQAIDMRLNQKVETSTTSHSSATTMPRIGRFEMLELLKHPWAKAFAPDRVRKAWDLVGIVPFSRRAERQLKWEEDKRTRTTDTDKFITNTSRVAEKAKAELTAVDVATNIPSKGTNRE